MFYEFEKDIAKSITPCSKHAESSALPKQEDESLRASQEEVDSASQDRSAQADLDSAGAESNQKREIDLADMADLAEAETRISGNVESDTQAESIEPTEEKFVKPEHGKRRESAVLDFSGCEGAYLLPYG